MYRIGKIVDVNNEQEEFQFIEIEETSFNNKKKKTTKIKALDIFITGSLNGDNYDLHFVINKPIEEYLKMDNYDRVRISSNHIVDSYINFNGVNYINLEINAEILKLSNELNIYIVFQEENKDFFGESEFSIDLNMIEAELI